VDNYTRRKIIYSRTDHSIITDKKSSKLSALCQSIVLEVFISELTVYTSWWDSEVLKTLGIK